jgi:hypothetical protein
LAALTAEGSHTFHIDLEKENDMHARVVTFMVKSERIEALASIHRDEVPALQQQGFKGSRLLVTNGAS